LQKPAFSIENMRIIMVILIICLGRVSVFCGVSRDFLRLEGGFRIGFLASKLLRTERGFLNCLGIGWNCPLGFS